MNNNSMLVLSYVNQAIMAAQIERAQNYNAHLAIVKLDLPFEPSEGDAFKEMMSFIHSFLDFSPIISDGGSSFVLFMHDTKLHTAVMTIKNMLMSLKIKYSMTVKGVGVTALEEDEEIEKLLARLHTLYMKSKVSKSKEIFYATSSFEYGSGEVEKSLMSIFTKDPTIKVYGFYKEAPMVHEAKVLEFDTSKFSLRLPKEYLTFLKREEFVYLEHHLVPDIMRADIVSIDMNHSVINLGKVKFLDNSPVHRKNIRVTPHKPVQALMTYEEEFQLEGIISDISKNSILLTTQLNKIEELQAKALQSKKFELSFHIESADKIVHPINVKAMIFKISGNQVILNIYPTPEAQREISEYITMCQNLLLLEAQSIH
jgi:hypothetical protein